MSRLAGEREHEQGGEREDGLGPVPDLSATEREDEPDLLDELAERMGFRDRLRAHATTRVIYRGGVALLGLAIVVAGLFLLPLPGPGWLVIFVGLGVLATEFDWAERLLHRVRGQVRNWTRWISRQALVVKLLVTAGGLCLVVGALVGTARLVGAPGWVPGWVPLIR